VHSHRFVACKSHRLCRLVPLKQSQRAEFSLDNLVEPPVLDMTGRLFEPHALPVLHKLAQERNFNMVLTDKFMTRGYFVDR